MSNSKVDWNKTSWDPLATKKRPLPSGLKPTGYISKLYPPPADPRCAHPETRIQKTELIAEIERRIQDSGSPYSLGGEVQDALYSLLEWVKEK